MTQPPRGPTTPKPTAGPSLQQPSRGASGASQFQGSRPLSGSQAAVDPMNLISSRLEAEDSGITLEVNEPPLSRPMREPTFRESTSQETKKREPKKIEVSMRYQEKADWFGRFLVLLLLGGSILAFVSWRKMDQLPSLHSLLPKLSEAAVVQPASSEPQLFESGAIKYSFVPHDRMQLSGIVLAKLEREAFGYSGNQASVNAMHIASICAALGKTVSSGAYQKLDVNAGVRDCVSASAGEGLPAEDFASLQLISNDGFTTRKIQALKVGDQFSVDGLTGSFSVERGSETRTIEYRNALSAPILLTSLDIDRANGALWHKGLWVGISAAALGFGILVLRGLFLLLSDLLTGNTKQKREVPQLKLAERKRKEREDQLRG